MGRLSSEESLIDDDIFPVWHPFTLLLKESRKRLDAELQREKMEAQKDSAWREEMRRG